VMDITTLITICDNVVSGRSKVLERFSKKKFSAEEKELMIAASEKGEFAIFSVDQIPGHWVRIGTKYFVDQEDPVYAATILEALGSLCERGYVRHQWGIGFILNDSGFKKARELAGRSEW